MTPNPCRCRATPTITEREQAGVHILRVECACGRHGATLMFTRPADRARMVQAAWDGWNLADDTPTQPAPAQ